eukprot:TRINITY_DN1151_c0_g2_i9.p1 TRINITY_DN1151_c0_g2~~TRINITY_DN1151_c0_g2_i9.p1  ORF type:complete len:298 (+),score=-8.57 TRINITY_DN1151_c0_g2_i9:207-1100(+)
MWAGVPSEPLCLHTQSLATAQTPILEDMLILPNIMPYPYLITYLLGKTQYSQIQNMDPATFFPFIQHIIISYIIYHHLYKIRNLKQKQLNKYFYHIISPIIEQQIRVQHIPEPISTIIQHFLILQQVTKNCFIYSQNGLLNKTRFFNILYIDSNKSWQESNHHPPKRIHLDNKSQYTLVLQLIIVIKQLPLQYIFTKMMIVLHQELDCIKNIIIIQNKVSFQSRKIPQEILGFFILIPLLAKRKIKQQGNSNLLSEANNIFLQRLFRPCHVKGLVNLPQPYQVKQKVKIENFEFLVY